eukprot:TRINITY_DN31146_c0_g1_i1.p1 TRINITY_DN31146_c0_g1~~TRINITY_DN31146_c0_g1_i1.p1  ORF type:complete len:1221 (-),score=211.99 TRINITY_DN31146_c0_g1_i1:190-3852(-)
MYGSGGGSDTGLLAESNDCGQALVRLLSRGHAIIAELQRAADALPTAVLQRDSPPGQKFAAVLPDFEVFRVEGALDRVTHTAELIELDEESRELHQDAVGRCFRILAAVRKYAGDLIRYFNELESGTYISWSLEDVAREEAGCQLMPESIALLGAMLLLVEERLPGLARERALVAFHRFTMGTNDAAPEFPDVCRLFRNAGRPTDLLTKRQPGYPDSFFSRFPLPHSAVKLAIGQLQTGDVYRAGNHYPLPEHRSHGLAAQAGLLYAILFFDVPTLESDVVAMREIVNRHFGDTWVVAFALGFTADLAVMWAPYKAAREALGAAITVSSAKHLRDRHFELLVATRQQLKDYLKEGVLTEEFVSRNTPALLSSLRQANTTIRWLLLQSTTSDPKMQAVIAIDGLKEQLLQALVDTALLEERVRGFLKPLVARREADWVELRSAASQAMDDLALYFSGNHALRRNVRNEELESWFRGLQARIDDLNFGDVSAGGGETLALGRRISQVHAALEEVEQFHEVAAQPQIRHFLSDARDTLKRMVRTVNLRGETLETVGRVADLSYAWKALGAYRQPMYALLGNSPGSVKGLRALFLKLASILEAPLLRIRQAGNSAHESLVSSYYSESLVEFMQSVLQELPRLIFGLLDQISAQGAARPQEQLASRISLEELRSYSERSDQASHVVGKLTQRIALLMRGIRETDVAVLGVMRLEPHGVLVDGLRRELARKIELLFASLAFSKPGPKAPLRRESLVAPLADLAIRCRALCRAFEYAQDYVGVSALQLWHNESARITRYLLHMELHMLLRRRLPAPRSSVNHDPDCPIEFPDGGSFLSRTIETLLALTDPKAAVGGLRGSWRLASTGEALFDGAAMEALHIAVGPPAVAAISRLLGFRIAKQLRQLTIYISKEIGHDMEIDVILNEVAQQAFGAASGSTGGSKTLRSAAQRMSNLFKPLVDALAVIGQHQLLRRCLHCSLQLHSKLEAPLSAVALGVLNDAELIEALDSAFAVAPERFDGDGQAESHELLIALQRRIAKSCELSGYSDPLRQLYVLVEQQVPPLRVDVLLTVLLLHVAITTPASNSSSSRSAGGVVAVSQRQRKRDTLKSLVGWKSAPPTASPSPVDEEPPPANQRGKTYAALVAGVATLLQQLPQASTDGLLELCGACLGGLCSEGAEGREASWFEGARLIDMVGLLLELLQLPRERLADVAPQGLLDLWPSPEAE